jgi:hypothetical protein
MHTEVNQIEKTLIAYVREPPPCLKGVPPFSHTSGTVKCVWCLVLDLVRLGRVERVGRLERVGFKMFDICERV